MAGKRVRPSSGRKAVRPAWAKKPDNPHKPREDGSSYIELVGGPLHGCWMRMYPDKKKLEKGECPFEPQTYVTMGARYCLKQGGSKGERDWFYELDGWETGVSPAEVNEMADHIGPPKRGKKGVESE